MNTTQLAARLSLALAALCAAALASGQNAPGEDPVVLSKRVTIQMSPVGPAKGSSPLDLVTDMPAWQKAKVARYEAKSTSQQGGVLGDSDVVKSTSSDGFKRTCIQEVGSNTATPTTANGAGRVGVSSQQQIVVLRGDLVNICK
jgi:hypothetical protein